MFKSFLVKRITEISTYGGLMLIFAHAIPNSVLFVAGVALICIGDETIKKGIGKFAPGLQAFIDGLTD